MGLVLNANGLYEYVKPPIDRSRASLGSAKDIISSIVIPGNFAYYAALRDLPTGIQAVQLRNDNVNVWLDTVVNEFGKKEEEASGFEFNLFGLDVGAVVTETVGAVANFGTSAFETSVDIFEATGVAIAGGFNTAVDFFETTGANIAGAAVSAWNTAENWIIDTATVINEVGASIGGAIANGASECWDWICGAASATWGVIQSVGADIFNFAISLIEGIASLLETIVDLTIIVGSAVGTIFTGAWDLGIGVGNWLSGNGFQMGGATEAMWDWTMGFTAENWVSMGFDAFYDNTGVGQWLDDNAHEWFKSDGIACQIGQGVGYVTGVIALTIVTGGTVSPILIAGGLAFSSGTTNAWAGMRDQSWEGIERAYDNGDIDQATYESMVAIKDMSTEDWQQIELMYQNGELPKEDYDAMLQIREISTDWKTVENYFGGINTGIEEGITTAAITALTLGIGSKVMSGLNKVLPKLTQVAPKGLQTVLNKLFSNVVEEGTESLVEFGGNLATTGSLDQALAQTGGVPGLAISMGIGMLLDVDIPGRKLAGNIDVDGLARQMNIPTDLTGAITTYRNQMDYFIKSGISFEDYLLKNNIEFFRFSNSNPEEIALYTGDPNLELLNFRERLRLQYGNNFNDQYLAGIWPALEKIRKITPGNFDTQSVINGLQPYFNINPEYGNYLRALVSNYDQTDVGRWMSSLTQDEIDAIFAYTKYLGFQSSAFLRGIDQVYTDSSGNSALFRGTDRNAINDDVNLAFSKLHALGKTFSFQNIDELIENMNSALAKSSLPDDIMLYRGVKGLFQNGMQIDLNQIVPGQILNDTAFLSTSLNPTGTMDNSNIMLEIYAPKGTAGAYIEPASGVSRYSQQEVLLGQNTNLQVVSQPYLDPVTGKYIVKCIVVPN